MNLSLLRDEGSVLTGKVPDFDGLAGHVVLHDSEGLLIGDTPGDEY